MHAGTITFADVVRAGGSQQTRTATEIRLRVMLQSGVVPQSSTGQSAQSANVQQPNGPNTAPAPGGGSAPDATLSQGGGGQVETIELGDVTGTVCDCGEIPPLNIPKAAAFPWWTLAGIPLICVSGICFGDDDTPPGVPPPPTPTPPPPTNPIPEPATLLLFGSGLLMFGAGARRRHLRAQRETDDTTEEV